MIEVNVHRFVPALVFCINSISAITATSSAHGQDNWTLNLHSVKCVNPQNFSDDVVVKVFDASDNKLLYQSSYKMKGGDVAGISKSVEVSSQHSARIMVIEDDPTKNDKLLEVTVSSTQGDVKNQTVTQRTGTIKIASYQLTYSVTRSGNNDELLKSFKHTCGTAIALTKGPKGFGLTQDESESTWPPGSTINVFFLNGNASQKSVVRSAAAEWMKSANIKFVFFDSLPVAQRDISVMFGSQGNNSRLGSQSRRIARQGEASMHLENVDIGTVLHEFGHALGLAHEHLNPNITIPWDRPAVYRYYMGPPNNWLEDQVTDNLFEVQHLSPLATEFDPLSIMAYSIDKSLTGGKFELEQNTKLSQMDRFWIGVLYPHGESWTYRAVTDNTKGMFVNVGGNNWKEYIFRDGRVATFTKELSFDAKDVQLVDKSRGIQVLLKQKEGFLRGGNNPDWVKFFIRDSQ